MDLIYSSWVDTNDNVFLQLMRLHVPKGSKVADVTYGKGSFWKQVPAGEYQLLATDLQSGTDLRALPYEPESIDCLVLDPPYIDGFFRPKASQLAHTASDFRERYAGAGTEGPFYHDGVLDIYQRGGWKHFGCCGPRESSWSNAKTRYPTTGSD